MPDKIENGHICENIVQNRSQADFQKGKKMNTQQSEQLFKASQEKIPGGVNSPVRAFGAVGRTPLFIKMQREAILRTKTATPILIMYVHGDRAFWDTPTHR